jgi:hypothetical protein
LSESLARIPVLGSLLARATALIPQPVVNVGAAGALAKPSFSVPLPVVIVGGLADMGAQIGERFDKRITRAIDYLGGGVKGQTAVSKAASGPKARRGYGTALAAGTVGSSRSIRSNNFPSPADSSANQTRA